ncbi:hypothetical protein SAMD00019534_059510, partial [Acytostelium subglobosum LB1]|uniref:hypothetical protein n=1 Tax=Acytostelium subglobosum LB1 TaxID=1410327 RepID=UPI000644999F
MLLNQYVYELLASCCVRWIDFVRLGATCQHYHRLMVRSSRWKQLNLGGCHWLTDKLLFHLTKVLDGYIRQGFQTPFVESLTLDGCYQLSNRVMDYISRCYVLSNIAHLSLDNCQITSIKDFFGRHVSTLAPPTNQASEGPEDPPQPMPRGPLLSLRIPTLQANQTTPILSHLSSLTSLTLPGSVDHYMMLRFIESSPRLERLRIESRNKDNLFNTLIIEKLCQLRSLQDIHLMAMTAMTGENVGMLAMNLVNIKRISITNNSQLTGDFVNVVLDSCKSLVELNIRYCRNVGDVSMRNTSLQVLDASHTITSANLDLPNLRTLLLNSWGLGDNDHCHQLFSRHPLLRHLDLTNCNVNDDQLSIILSYCQNIQTLNLDRCPITRTSINHIFDNCKDLFKIVLSNTVIAKHPEQANKLLELKYTPS